MVQFCYLRLYFGTDIASYRLLPVADPDLQISRRGGPEIIEGPVYKKKIFFRPFGPQLNPKIRGAAPPPPPAPPLDPPLVAMDCKYHQQPDKYETDSDNGSDDEGDFEV